MFVEVVLLRQTKIMDNLFTYKIPPSLLSTIQVGSKVQVPFGQGNQTHEAIVVKLIEDSALEIDYPVHKIKAIESLCDDAPWMSRVAIELAKWLRVRYVCNYQEAFSLFMPAGTKLKRDYEIILNSDKLFELQRLKEEMTDEKSLNLIEAVERGDKVLLSAIEHKETEKLAQKLIKQGIFDKVERVFTDVEDQEKSFVDLKLTLEQAEEVYEKIPERFSAQRRLMKHMIHYGRTELSALRQMTGLTTAQIQTFVDRNWLSLESEVVLTLPKHYVFKEERAYNGLSDHQQEVFSKAVTNIIEGQSQAYLLQGITGSGKTEVYMEWVDLALQKGRQALMMVPEISLTPQMIDRFRRRFGDCIAVFHSKLNLRERYDQWQAVKQGKLSIVIGARSAVFAPFHDLGLIIVDEAHDGSYKSETSPKYNGVDVAFEMSKLFSCPIVLGSATPSVEQFYRMTEGEMTHLKLTKRFRETLLPTVDLIDMRDELSSGNRHIFSRRLYDTMHVQLKNKKQIMLLMNRKGFSTHVSCRSCGYAMKCPDCEVALTYHKGASHLRCSYCQYRVAVPQKCPSCGSGYFKHFGTGTEKVMEEAQKLFPNAKIARLDSETVSKKGSLESIIESFEQGEIDILIGTQMISKGLDFKNVGLVGVIAADITLNFPDYHAPERTFALLTQVAGRAGRGDERGHVIIQTYEPDHYAIKATMTHNFSEFYQNEIRIREAFKYPPYYLMASVLVTSTDNQEAQKAANDLYHAMKSKIGSSDEQSLDIAAPNPAVFAKIKNRYRWQIVIKYKKGLENQVSEILRETCLDRFNRKNYTEQLRVIIDPQAQTIL